MVAIGAISGCIGGSDGIVGSNDGPAEYPDGPASYDDRAVLTPDGMAEYTPLSVTVKDRIPYDALGVGTRPGSWDRDTIEWVEPTDDRRIAVVRMRYTNHAEGADLAPSIGSLFAVRLPDLSTIEAAHTIDFIPSSTPDAQPFVRHVRDTVDDPTDYTLNKGPYQTVSGGETVTAWFSCPIPGDTDVDEVFPAMGEEPDGRGFPVRWANGYETVERYTDD